MTLLHMRVFIVSIMGRVSRPIMDGCPAIPRSWKDLPVTKGKRVSLVTWSVGDVVGDISSGEEHVGNVFLNDPNGLGLHFRLSFMWTWIGLCSMVGQPYAQSIITIIVYDNASIERFNPKLQTSFHMKYLRNIDYFSSLEVNSTSNETFLLQYKYASKFNFYVWSLTNLSGWYTYLW